jgi:hypothetical protein
MKFQTGTTRRGFLDCFDVNSWRRSVSNRDVNAHRSSNLQAQGKAISENFSLAGRPCRGALIFPAIGDLAFLAAGHEFENDHFAAVQTSPSVVLGSGKDQPVPFQDFVCPTLGEDLIAAVRIHLQ